MVTSQMLKTEIDLLAPQYYAVVHNVLQSLEMNKNTDRAKQREWSQFVSDSFGTTAKFPLAEEDQLSYESRDELI